MSVEATIREKLTRELQPESLTIVNESHKHSGHAGSPGTGESHFNVTVVSQSFLGLHKVARFRKVHKILKEELDGPVHALSLELKTPDEA
ncbi:MAG: BolA family transcriptional regulator [Candidatus Eremiobacteraeota bacterium]|nr:BolA family transcriptional regulator [Candidatus Eremiobacteraeota bacterium]